MFLERRNANEIVDVQCEMDASFEKRGPLNLPNLFVDWVSNRDELSVQQLLCTVLLHRTALPLNSGPNWNQFQTMQLHSIGCYSFLLRKCNRIHPKCSHFHEKLVG